MRLNVRWRILPPHISPAGQIFVSCMGTCIDACMGCECVCLRVRACARACVCVCNREIVYVGVFDTHIHLHPTATKLNYAHARTHARACARTHTHTHTHTRSSTSRPPKCSTCQRRTSPALLSSANKYNLAFCNGLVFEGGSCLGQGERGVGHTVGRW